MTKKLTVLNNGLTVITDMREADVSTMLSYWVKAGGNHEKNYPYGIAHFLEHMMFKGTTTRDKNEINDGIDEIGGSFNAGTYPDKTTYYTMVPFDKWKVGTEILTDMMFHSIFPSDELEKEKKVVLEEIKRSEDDIAGYGRRVLFSTLHQNHPERDSVLGTPESVTSITRDDLVRFVSEFYQTENLVFVATGNVNHDELVAFLESITPKEIGRANVKLDAFIPPVLTGESITFERDIKQAHLRFALLGPTAHDKDAVIADLTGKILGSGMTSRLFKKIREEHGLAYSANCGVYQSDDEGYFVGYVGTDANQLEEVKDMIVAEFELLKTELVSEKELNKVKNAAVGQHLISQDSKMVINYNLAVEHLYKIDSDPIKYAEEIRSVTAEEIKDFANKHFGRDKMVFVETVPKKEA